MFRTHDVGHTDHTKRVAGRTSDGEWYTQKWLIPKQDAFVENSYLHSNREATKRVLNQLGSVPRHTVGDKFVSKPKEYKSKTSHLNT